MVVYNELNNTTSWTKQQLAPRLLVVIPHRNSSRTLTRCLSSIDVYISPTIRSETVLIDDCSDEEHVAFIRDLSSRFLFSFLTSDVWAGVSHARNIGIDYAASKGFEYVMFVDADDHLISSIKLSMFLGNELTFFHSCETRDCYSEHQDFSSHILKNNINQYYEMSLLLEEYSRRPNRVPTLTTCWAKIYSTAIIEKHKLKFNEKMHTFEDVDFLFSYLIYASKIEFQDLNIYAHTNSLGRLSATFGQINQSHSLFSFLQASRTLRKLIRRRHSNTRLMFGHYLACYYSIAFVRLAHRCKTVTDRLLLYQFITRRINSGFVRRCFAEYDPKLAGVRGSIRLLVLFRLPLALTMLLFWIAARRYK
jgi:glycosyltransferase involved in cell wall biosynthesis